MRRTLIALCIGLAIGVTIPRELDSVTHAAGTSPYGQFAGNWFFHGGLISIQANGHGVANFRTYINCSTTVLTACDYFDKHGNIWGGGYMQFRLLKAQGNRASGTISGSAFSYQVRTPFTLTRNANDTISFLGVGPYANVRGCGPRAPTGACGA